jgi:light-regulated signal transduction histidine kinase (bacteriophytochrome)
VPWLLLVGFGIAAAAALVLLRKSLSTASQLTTANADLGVANQKLERRATELARSNEQLERFASIASHDLQEPLRKVRTFAELARQEREHLSDSGHDYLVRMSDAAQRMQDLIDDLLAFSRITTQSRRIEQVELAEVAREVVADLETVIDEADATVEIGDLPTLSADPLRMRQLLQNLISNAIKFRRQGVRPLVRVVGGVRGLEAEIVVSDNGIGFEPRYAGRIFRVFERLHGRDAYPGTGIGLALCRRIAESHGGTITAEGTVGEGSTFTVCLPLQPIDDLLPTAPATVDEERPLAPV